MGLTGLMSGSGIVPAAASPCFCDRVTRYGRPALPSAPLTTKLPVLWSWGAAPLCLTQFARLVPARVGGPVVCWPCDLTTEAPTLHFTIESHCAHGQAFLVFLGK